MRRAIGFGVLATIRWTGTNGWAQGQDERAIRGIVDQYVRSMSSVDPTVSNQIFNQVAPFSGLFYPTFVQRAGSPDEVRSSLARVMRNVSVRRMERNREVTVRVDRRMGWAEFAWRWHLTFRDGSKQSLRDRTTLIFSKDRKDWRIVHSHSSLPGVLPPSGAEKEAARKRIVRIEQDRGAQRIFRQGRILVRRRSGLPYARQAEAIRSVQAFLDGGEVHSWQMLDPQVQVIGETVVLTYYFSQSGSAHGKDFHLSGKESVIFVKENGDWRVVHKHRSSNQAANNHR